MSQPISLQQAIDMTKKFRDLKDAIVNPSYAGILSTCETFDRKDVDNILAQSGCVQLRVYFGIGADLKLRAILVGVNNKDEDILPTPVNAASGVITDEGALCPPICPPSSPLNS